MSKPTKPNKRRKFLQKSVQLGLFLPILGTQLLTCGTEPSEKDQSTPQASGPKPLRILILGGTSFLGPHQIAYAIGRGHSITTFTRGKTEPTIHKELFKQVTSLVGDRKDNLTALETGEWDVVIDNSGHDVKWAEATAELLKDRVGRYVFTSSTGVYYPYLGNDIDETTALLKEEPAEVEDEDMKIEYWYAVMKTNSELAAQKHFGADRTLAIRPTYMFGPGDKTDRFIHWPIRLSRGGEVLVPGKDSDQVQYIDVRDVAEFMIRMIEEEASGAYNLVGPTAKQTMPEFVHEAAKAFEVEHDFVQINDYEFLKAQGVPYLVPWIMPEGNNHGSALINNKKALAAGLTFRPLPQSIKETHDWWYSDALTDERRKKFEEKEDGALTKEKAIIAAWKAQNT